MKMLMIVCPEGRQEEIRTLMENHGVHGYSELNQVIGEGKTGKKLGTPAWPEKSCLIFSVLETQQQNELVKSLKAYQANLLPGEGMRAFMLPAESIV